MKKIAISMTIIVIALSFFATPSFAQESSDDEAKWEVKSFTSQPANPNTVSPYKIIAEVKPGETYRDSIILKNHSDENVELFNFIADVIQDENGKDTYSSYTKEQKNIGTWGTIEESTTMEPGEGKTIEFQINVPSDTELGLYKAGITTKKLGEAVGNVRKTFRILTPLEITVTNDPQHIPRLNDTTVNIFAPTPFFWGTVAIFVSSMGYLAYSSRKEKRKKKAEK